MRLLPLPISQAITFPIAVDLTAIGPRFEAVKIACQKVWDRIVQNGAHLERQARIFHAVKKGGSFTKTGLYGAFSGCAGVPTDSHPMDRADFVSKSPFDWKENVEIRAKFASIYGMAALEVLEQYNIVPEHFSPAFAGYGLRNVFFEDTGDLVYPFSAEAACHGQLTTAALPAPSPAIVKPPQGPPPKTPNLWPFDVAFPKGKTWAITPEESAALDVKEIGDGLRRVLETMKENYASYNVAVGKEKQDIESAGDKIEKALHISKHAWHLLNSAAFLAQKLHSDAGIFRHLTWH